MHFENWGLRVSGDAMTRVAFVLYGIRFESADIPQMDHTEAQFAPI
jgi:hypothetical protein